MSPAAQDTQPQRRESDDASGKFRLTVTSIGALLAVVVGTMGKENLPLAIGFVVVVVLGVLLAIFFDEQTRNCKRAHTEQSREIAGWRRDHKKCSDDLHDRDILIAMCYMHIRHDSTQVLADRRKSHKRKPPSELEAAFQRIIGPDRATGLLDEARRLLTSGQS